MSGEHTSMLDETKDLKKSRPAFFLSSFLHELDDRVCSPALRYRKAKDTRALEPRGCVGANDIDVLALKAAASNNGSAFVYRAPNTMIAQATRQDDLAC